MSAALEYHRATSAGAARGWQVDDELRFVGPRPMPFKSYGDAERLSLEISVAGPLLQDGAGIVRSQPGRDYGGGTMNWRAYSSAGALYPVEAYVADAAGLYSFDVLERSLVRLAEGDARAAVSGAVDATAETFVVLTGIHARTGWKYLERGYRHVWWDAGTMLANLLALAAAEELKPRLYIGFVDRELNEVLGVDGVHERAIAVLGLGDGAASQPAPLVRSGFAREEGQRRYPLAENAHEASSLDDVDAVRAWRSHPGGVEPRLSREELVGAIRRRRSVRDYGDEPLPRDEFAALLSWSDASIPADVPRVVREVATVAAVEALAPGVYDARLELVHEHDEGELRERVAFAAMEQEYLGRAAVTVFQLADVDAVVARHRGRGYRWAQLEAGIRAGRLQVGAFRHGWGAAASTFYDDEVPRLLETHEQPMLMVAIGPRR